MILAILLAASPPRHAKAPPKPPKVEWIDRKRGETIIRDPNGFDPETKYARPDYTAPDWLKDPFVWA